MNIEGMRLAERFGGRKKGATNGTQRRGGGGGAEGGLGDWELFGWGALRVFAGLLRNRHSARLWGINVER